MKLTEQETQPYVTEADLFSVVEELERSVETLAASLEQVRSTVRQVASGIRELNTPISVAPALTVVQAAPEPDLELADAPTDFLSTAPLQKPAETESPEESAEKLAAETGEFEAAAAEAAREEVRKAVEATRAHLSWSNLRVDSGFSISSPEDVAQAVSEDAARHSQEPAPETQAEAEHDSEEARREEVRLAVERARADMIAAEASEPQANPEELRREEVRLAVERARAEMHASEDHPAVTEDESRREEVRKLVESNRGAGDWSHMKSDAGSWGQFPSEPAGFSIRGDQAPPRPLDSAQAAEAVDGPASEEAARRDEVRRTVEAARAEMMGDSEPEHDRPRIVPIMPQPGQPVAKGSDFHGPPIIVIEDPLGRVELSQVFATLSKVDRSAQAALLNYSPHSVTIGLNVASSVPDADELVLAAQSVFGRVCKVKSEGNRTAIEIGTHTVGS